MDGEMNPGGAKSRKPRGARGMSLLMAAFLTAHLLWPMLPMPQAWVVPMPRHMQAAGHGNPTPSAPTSQKGHHPGDSGSSPLNCSICQLAHGSAGLAALPLAEAPAPRIQGLDPLCRHEAGIFLRQITAPMGARAPPFDSIL